MKFNKLYVLAVLIIVSLLTFKFVVLKKTDNRLIYAVEKGPFVESITVSGIFHKTATDTQKAATLAAYQGAVNTLTTAKQNKEAADATMWYKRQAVLTAQNGIDYKNDNTTNPSTNDDYTDLEKNVIDSALVQAEKDFHASEQKYKEADMAIAAASAQVHAAKLDYDDALLDEPVITVDINEVYAPKINVGQKVTILFDALKDTPLKGTVKSIDSVGTVTSGIVTFETKIDIDNVHPDVKPNMTAVVNIEIIRKENTFAIPSSGILYKDGKTYIQKIDGQKTIPTQITVGEKGLTKVEVLAGLENGMRILVDPTTKNL